MFYILLVSVLLLSLGPLRFMTCGASGRSAAALLHSSLAPISVAYETRAYKNQFIGNSGQSNTVTYLEHWWRGTRQLRNVFFSHGRNEFSSIMSFFLVVQIVLSLQMSRYFGIYSRRSLWPSSTVTFWHGWCKVSGMPVLSAVSRCRC